MIAMNGKRTWIGGLLDDVIEMVLAVLKEFSWCCGNARATGRNGDTVWCVCNNSLITKILVLPRIEP